MNFEDFKKSNKVIKGDKDLEKAKALIKMSGASLSFLKTLPLTEQSATLIFTNYYEALRQILEAISLTQGYKIYSHEAYSYYLKELKEETISEKFDRLRKLRNGANYYGKSISKEVTKNAKEDVIKITNKLKKKYLINIH